MEMGASLELSPIEQTLQGYWQANQDIRQIAKNMGLTTRSIQYLLHNLKAKISQTQGGAV